MAKTSAEKGVSFGPGPALTARLRGLSFPQGVRVIEEIERWWAEQSAVRAE